MHDARAASQPKLPTTLPVRTAVPEVNSSARSVPSHVEASVSFTTRRALRWRAVLFLAVILGVPPAVRPLTAQEPVVVGTRHEVPSTAFGRPRSVRVSLPAGYDGSDRRYPVVVHLDGDTKFGLVAEEVTFLARSGRIPPMIVVGIDNPDSRTRTRDLTPDPDPEFPGSGGAAAMVRFLDEDLLPWIDASYRTSGQRVLIGHSFGGLFALHALATAPDLFDAYISAGAAVWMADDAFLGRLAESRVMTLDRPTWLYFTAGEGDGGGTLPSNQRLAAALRTLDPPQLTWEFAIPPGENHFSNFPITLHQGLMALFPIWGASADLLAAATEPTQVAAWFAERHERLGWRDVLPDFELQVVGYRLAADGRTEVALALFEALGQRSPGYPDGWEGQGRMLERLGRSDEALVAYRRALEAARAPGVAAYVRERMLAHVERLGS